MAVNDFIFTNSEMGNTDTKKYCKLDRASSDLLTDAMQRFSISARSYFKILKIARTVADLDGSPQILIGHIAEALQYRLNDYERL